MNLTQISDDLIKEEYHRRFTLPVGTPIQNSNEAVDHLRQFIPDPGRESFIVLFLNGSNRVITTEVLFQGTLTSSAVYPRELIKRVLAHNAAALVLCHNHPSGNLNPSRDDIAITGKLTEACKTIDVKVHDHIILAGNGFYSMLNHGLM